MRTTAAIALAFALAGCAALPIPAERGESRALADVAATSLAQIAAASKPARGSDPSGFRLLAEGAEALEARIALIRRAEKSVDVQYYLIANDRTGRQFLAELSAAAARGVRIRLLVDDLYAIGEDALFAALAGQPGFQVRLFNPLPVRGGAFAARVAFSAHEFARINHRMHNKLLIADNTFAVSGGRNIGDEYFDRASAAHFIDMDLLSSGDVVATLSSLFDEFWNSPFAYPAESLLGARRRDAAGRGESAAPAAPASDGESVPFEPGPLAAELAAGRVALRYAAARVVADRPAQIGDNDRARPDGPVMQAHLDLIASARSSVLVATPYFVPGRGGLEALREARARGVRCTVLTNSLATTDEPLVHFGYARYRIGLLRLGVGLHELRPTLDAANSGGGSAGERHGASLGRLHAKLVVVDGRWISIGSMNMDRRSARSNTESTIVIDDPILAGEVAAFLERRGAMSSYALRLDSSRKRVEWLGDEARGVLRTEPRHPRGRGIKPRLASFFVSEEML